LGSHFKTDSSKKAITLQTLALPPVQDISDRNEILPLCFVIGGMSTNRAHLMMMQKTLDSSAQQQNMHRNDTGSRVTACVAFSLVLYLPG
jgi:hypothetical protein